MMSMHEATLGDQYLASGSHRATWNGHDVWGSFHLEFERAVELTVDCEVGEPGARQGVCLRFPKRKGRIADVEGERFVLWADSGEFPVRATMLASRGPFAVRVWNCWTGRHGSVDAWIGNAGMRLLEQAPGRLVFVCSAGVGDVDFSDLRVTVAWPADVAVAIPR